MKYSKNWLSGMGNCIEKAILAEFWNSLCMSLAGKSTWLCDQLQEGKNFSSH